MTLKQSRTAGILLHITSLPGPFGIGDLGPEAYRFADQLQQCGQRYWQVLPVNPIDPSHASPYSALSAMAGNIYLISPELLEKEGLLHKEMLDQASLPSSDTVDFKEATSLKMKLLETAYQSFQQQPDHPLRAAFNTFCVASSWWLDDYAAYRALTACYKGKPWPEWEPEHRSRQSTLTDEQQAMALKEKWWQFIFDRQWNALRKHCNKRDVLLFGDLPFYVNHEAADVWAHPDLFQLDDKGQMSAVAGVPPDYFNDQGQLWNMPVYNWDVLQEQQYDWWVLRIRRNLEWFDLIRMDHFRAFSAYWEVAAGASSAREGKWQQGPGKALFDVLNDAFPDLPFVAEDLGDIDQHVHALRDHYQLPGMRVLLFAFGDDMPDSEHIPHQYNQQVFAFTGTHDNNTCRGWFKQEADKKMKKNITRYTGLKASAKKIPLILSRLLYASVAGTVILPMQDILGLPARSRMNNPSVSTDNWKWRMEPSAFSQRHIKRLRRWVHYYGRNSRSSSKFK